MNQSNIAGEGEGTGTIVVSVDLPSPNWGGKHKAILQKHGTVTKVEATVYKGTFSATQNLILSDNTATGTFTQL